MLFRLDLSWLLNKFDQMTKLPHLNAYPRISIEPSDNAGRIVRIILLTNGFYKVMDQLNDLV